MKILGIEFAPLNVPLERRLQTVAAASWFFILAFGGFIGLGLAAYLIIYTRFWWLTLIYLGWMFFIDKNIEERGGRPFKFMKDLTWWKYLRDYFPLELVKLPQVELDPKRNYLFCSFPHGMLCAGTFNGFVYERSGYNEMFPHHKASVVTLAQHFMMPFFRDFALSLSGISSSAKSIDYCLSRPEGGRIAILMVGGAAEAYYCKPGQYTFILNNRKGFIKLALKNGSPLVPVLSFGETDLFSQIGSSEGRFHQFQETLRKYVGMAPVIPIGRGFFQYSLGIIPQRKPVTTVVGFPLEVTKIENPTKEEINELHEKFKKHLINMFEEQKHKYLKNSEKTKVNIL